MSAFARFRHSVPFCILSFVVTLSAQQGAPPRPLSRLRLLPILDARFASVGGAWRCSRNEQVRDATGTHSRPGSCNQRHVVEFGSARYQERIDRFMRGDNVRTICSARYGRTRRPGTSDGTDRSTKTSSVPCAPRMPHFLSIASSACCWVIRPSTGTLCIAATT